MIFYWKWVLFRFREDFYFCWGFGGDEIFDALEEVVAVLAGGEGVGPLAGAFGVVGGDGFGVGFDGGVFVWAGGGFEEPLAGGLVVVARPLVDHVIDLDFVLGGGKFFGHPFEPAAGVLMGLVVVDVGEGDFGFLRVEVGGVEPFGGGIEAVVGGAGGDAGEGGGEDGVAFFAFGE